MTSNRKANNKANNKANKSLGSFSDHDHWAKMDYWDIHEGIVLLLNASPDDVKREDMLGERVSANSDLEFIRRYIRINAVARRSLQSKKHIIQRIHPLDFLQWADNKEIPVSDLIRDAVVKFHGENIDWEAKCKAMEQRVAELEGKLNKGKLDSNLDPRKEKTFLRTIYVLTKIQYSWGNNKLPNTRAQEIISDAEIAGVKAPAKNTLVSQLVAAYELEKEFKVLPE